MRIVRAATVDVLLDDLARELVDAPPADPLAPVDVAVPGRGMERWLAQHLASVLGAGDAGDGVCANVRFPFPGAVVGRILDAALGDAIETGDPWSPARLAWPLLSVLDALPDDAVFAPLRAHLTEDGTPAHRRRYPLARRIADLFDRYALHRPRMVGAWASGTDVDGDGRPLESAVAWQPALWRLLATELGTPSPDLRFAAAIDALSSAGPAVGNAFSAPVRVFGVLSLPFLHLELLQATARLTEVTVYALAPCPAWPAHAAAPSPAHPLLASCGTEARAAHDRLGALAIPAGREAGAGAPAAEAPDADGKVGTALRVLQDDVRSDRARGVHGPGRRPLAPGDLSVRIHACHGPTRQLEVLRECLLGLLEDDPTLEPRDVVVLTPDIAAFEPMITAVFSAEDDGTRTDDGHQVPALPFRVADRTLHEENEVARTLLAVLDLAGARVTATQVLDLLAAVPIRSRFGLHAADVSRIADWTRHTGIRWGIDAEHRGSLAGIDDPTHTWKRGIDRLALGAAMPDTGFRMVAGMVPHDDVEGADVELVGRLTAATDAIFSAVHSLASPRDVATWRDDLAAIVANLLDPGDHAQHPDRLTTQLAAVRDELDTLVADSRGPDGRSSTIELTLDELRTLVTSRFGERGGRARYGTGAVTFAGLVPLRNVPHRVVCLVGMDDEALPRNAARHGFDLLAAHPQPGDPDPRTEDRQLFLDAVLAARDNLVVTYTGRDPRTNETRQPAVVVSELLDTLRATFTPPPGTLPGGPSTRDASPWDPDAELDRRFVVRHPLQPYNPRYFGEDADDPEPLPRSFDPHQLAAARAAVGGHRPAPVFLPPGGLLPSPGEDELDPTIVDLADLVRFLEHPVRFVLQRRIGIGLGDDDPRAEDRDPITLTGLQRWQLGRELLDRIALSGSDPAREDLRTWREAVFARGTVPIGGPGDLDLGRLEQQAAVVAAVTAGIAGERHVHGVDVTVPLPGAAAGEIAAVRLVGTVPMIGSTIVHASVTRARARHVLATWTRALAAMATSDAATPVHARIVTPDDRVAAGHRDIVLTSPDADPAPSVEDATTGREPSITRSHTPRQEPSGPPHPTAQQRLGELVALYMRGHSRPVPLMPETSRAFAHATARGRTPDEAFAAAASAWEGSFRTRGESQDPYVVQAFGARAELRELASATSFVADAQRVWHPILAAESTPDEAGVG